ncbi:MAG: hypothetical protein U0990_06090 [Candidatus Nanopelagicales bacterium]|nr:hypothetical protein [Candidatus Nanopelagicales bacterium]MDZ4249643.1 hypothetical protein [Candidatus Nanopelagicales bacterium]
MKTAISVPDSTFARAEQKAHELGWSRSQFYATAAERLLAQMDQESLTNAINDALGVIGDSDDSGKAAVAAGRKTLRAGAK